MQLFNAVTIAISQITSVIKLAVFIHLVLFSKGMDIECCSRHGKTQKTITMGSLKILLKVL